MPAQGRRGASRRQRRVDDHWPYVRQFLEVGVDVDGVEDAEILLADLVAAPCRPTNHLIVEDAAVDAAHEDQIDDRRDVDRVVDRLANTQVLQQPVLLIQIDMRIDIRRC